jgi:peroxin-7
LLSTVAADGLLKIFDTRTSVQPIQTIRAGDEEVLSCDWNKYDGSTIATGGKDRGVKIWDLRAGRCMEELRGHGLAVKRVQ